MEIEEPLVWFISLKEKGYFEGKRNLPPQAVKNQPGFFTIPFWNVLSYLERVVKINKGNPSEEITKGIAEVVDSIISYTSKDGKRIDNYRTDWFVTKIIFMLPHEKWGEKYIDFVRIAVKGSFGSTLIQSEISQSVLPALIENKAINLILKLLEVIFDFDKSTNDKSEKIKPLMEKYWQRDALENSRNK